MLEWCSASSRGLGSSTGVSAGAVRVESVYARKRTSSPTARAFARQGAYDVIFDLTLRFVFVLIRVGSVLVVMPGLKVQSRNQTIPACRRLLQRRRRRR